MNKKSKKSACLNIWYVINKMTIFAICKLQIFIVMKKHNGMRPQDVVILLKMMTYGENTPVFSELAASLQISAGEVSEAMERNRMAGLVNPAKTQVNKLALREFLIYGLKYVFPPQIGASVRGIATAHSAPPVSNHIAEGRDVYVWSYYKGTRRGNSIVPLYDKIPQFIEEDPDLYEYLALVDTLRVGKNREVEIAMAELDKKMSGYGG
jgi:predicted transcriptional regulator